MKKLLSILSLLVAMTSVTNAAPKIDELIGHHKINVVLDYSEARILRMCESDLMSFDPEWGKSKQDFFRSFCYGANTVSHSSWKDAPDLSFGRFEDAEYTLFVKILRVDIDGDTVIQTTLKNNATNDTVFFEEECNGDSKLTDMVELSFLKSFEISHAVSICHHHLVGLYWAARDFGDVLMKRIEKK